MPRRTVSCAVFALALSLMAAVQADSASLNGTWILDEAASLDFDTAARELNRKLNERQRAKKPVFDRERVPDTGLSQYEQHALATRRMIYEDNRSRAWAVPDDIRVLLDARRIKLYQSNRIAVVYDDQKRRLLTVNPAGRAYSASGTRMTRDVFGRSLTYLDGDAIVIETDLVSGDKLVERFEAGPQADRMTVSIRFQMSARGPWLEYGKEFFREP